MNSNLLTDAEKNELIEALRGHKDILSRYTDDGEVPEKNRKLIASIATKLGLKGV